MTHPPYTLGWVHNLESAPATSHGQRVITIAVIFPVISVVATCLRIAVRFTVSSIGLDDVCIAISTLFGIGYSAVTIFQTKWGLGLGAADFPAENAVPFSRVQYAGGPLYCLAVLGFKLSLLTSYLRVAGFNHIYARILNMVIALVVVSQVIFTCLLSFACRPIAKQWNPSIPGHCIHTLPTYFALGGTSLTWDLLIIILPFPILRRLQLDRRNKFALGALFGLGFFVTIIQAIRMQKVAALETYTESEPVIEWSVVEINLGVFIACVPAFAPLLKAFGKKVVSHGSRSRSRMAAYSDRKSTTPVVKESAIHSGLDDDEIELCDHPWANQSRVGHNAHARQGSSRMTKTGRKAEDSDNDHHSGTSAGSRSSGQRIHVLYEVTVQGDRAEGPP